MSNRAPCLLGLGLLASLCSPATAAANAEFFPIHCRGQLAHQLTMYTGDAGAGAVRANLYIYSIKNKTKAGEYGTSLAQGTCAWEVRALKASEPTTLWTKVDIAQSTLLVYESVVDCMGKKDCAFEVQGYIEGDKIWFDPYQVVVRYPNFTD